MTDTLIEKLIKLRKKVPYIQKEQKQYMKFSVISSEAVLKEFNSHMNGLKLFLKTEVVNKQVDRLEIGKNEKTGKTIFSYLVTLDMLYTWVDGEDPTQKEEIRFAAMADDENSSYAYGQALTYAEKTFFLKEFNIPTDDADPDTFQKEILKRINITPEQIEGVKVQLNKLEELTEQHKEAFLEQAKMTNSVATKKNIEDFSGYDFGLVMNTLTGWVNGYKNKTKKSKEQKKA